jgi:hypothetical protein
MKKVREREPIPDYVFIKKRGTVVRAWGECRPSATLTSPIKIPRAYREGKSEKQILPKNLSTGGRQAVHHTLLYAKFRIFGRQREFGFALFSSHSSGAGRPHHLLRVGAKIGQIESSVALAQRGFGF